jgi:hypothetical protein
MIKCIRFHVFTHDGCQYRAKLIGEKLVYLWQRTAQGLNRVTPEYGALIWASYKAERKSA